MQEEERKGWMTRSRRREGRNSREGQERMNDLKWERRKEFKRRKVKDGWPKWWERRKECKWKKGKDRGPEVGREEGMQEK
jgi:hypothetical protein